MARRRAFALATVIAITSCAPRGESRSDSANAASSTPPAAATAITPPDSATMRAATDALRQFLDASREGSPARASLARFTACPAGNNVAAGPMLAAFELLPAMARADTVVGRPSSPLSPSRMWIASILDISWPGCACDPTRSNGTCSDRSLATGRCVTGCSSDSLPRTASRRGGLPVHECRGHAPSPIPSPSAERRHVAYVGPACDGEFRFAHGSGIRRHRAPVHLIERRDRRRYEVGDATDRVISTSNGLLSSTRMTRFRCTSSSWS